MLRTARSLIRNGLLLGVGLSLAVSPASATTVKKMSVEQMHRSADSVVRGRALGSYVRTDPDTLLNYTITRFEVTDDIKGPRRAGDHMEIEVIGGAAPGGDWATVVAGTPVFTEGLEFVLFTRPGHAGRRHVVGFFQGALRIYDGEDGPVLLSPVFAVPDADRQVTTVRTRPSELRRSGQPATTVTTTTVQTSSSSSVPTATAGRPATAPGRQGGRVKVSDFLDSLRQIELDDRDVESRP